MALSITFHFLKDACPGCGKNTGGPECASCFEAKKRRYESPQDLMLVKETLNLLFMRTMDDQAEHDALRAMLLDMHFCAARKESTLTNTPRELLRRMSRIVGKTMLRTSLDDVKTHFFTVKSQLAKPTSKKLLDKAQELENRIHEVENPDASAAKRQKCEPSSNSSIQRPMMSEVPDRCGPRTCML